MQVSFSETYNIVTADAVNNNVPVVISEEIDFVLPIFKAECTDVNNIVRKLNLAYKTRNLGFTKLNKLLLIQSNNKAKRLWFKALGVKEKYIIV